MFMEGIEGSIGFRVAIFHSSLPTLIRLYFRTIDLDLAQPLPDMLCMNLKHVAIVQVLPSQVIKSGH